MGGSWAEAERSQEPESRNQEARRQGSRFYRVAGLSSCRERLPKTSPGVPCLNVFRSVFFPAPGQVSKIPFLGINQAARPGRRAS